MGGVSIPLGFRERFQTFFHDPRSRRPCTIAVAPLPLLCFLWAFFAFTRNEPLVISDNYVPMIRAYIQVATLISAVTATTLSCLVSLCFSLSVRYATAAHLSTGNTSMYALTSATHISQNTLWLHNPRVKWGWLVCMSFVTVSLQAPLLTPFLSIRELEISREVTGHDLDMLNNGLLSVVNETQIVPHVFFYPALSDVMSNALRSKISPFNNGFTYDAYAFLSSTGESRGVQPASFNSTLNDMVYSKSNTTLPVSPGNLNTPGGRAIDSTLLQTMMLVQQGFTADVDCKATNPQNLTNIQTQLQTQTVGPDNFTMLTPIVVCNGEATFQDPIVYDTQSPYGLSGVLTTVGCSNDNNSTVFEIVIRGTGIYAKYDQVICTVSPKITKVNVTYQFRREAPVGLKISEHILETSLPVWGAHALMLMFHNIYFAQGISGNTFGNNIYIKSGMEYIGTFLRSLWSQSNGVLSKRADWHGPPQSMLTPTVGSYQIVTFGWYQDAMYSPLFLVPTTIVVLATYAVLIYGIAVARAHADNFLPDDVYFNPSDIVHVVAARTPDIRHLFGRFSDDQSLFLGRTRVAMGDTIEGRVLEVSARNVLIPDGRKRTEYIDSEISGRA
ncbi:hypothetical protein NP233_g7220 [Leucocoprinus birnbaumii]|uniref:Transmembrane protein n=1 Tax=Leucocoprinus birnbaumii TaxID=56174 RepID=A0AAD5VPP3_9AGAR|nr:hypothetical protein NP233_g7220 [Leucocoprinus birnbaumii]